MSKTKKPGSVREGAGLFLHCIPEKNNACNYYTTYSIPVYSYQENGWYNIYI